jgi:hypothetical protein
MKILLRELQALYEFFGDGGDARSRIGGESAALTGIFVAENDPEAGAVGFVVAWTDGAGELGEFEACATEKFGEDAAGIVDEIAKSLGNKNAVYVARSRVFELMEIVIGQRLFEWDFDGGGGLVLVGGDSNGHGGMVLHHAGYFG